jgi:hypothetical protein
MNQYGPSIKTEKNLLLEITRDKYNHDIVLNINSMSVKQLPPLLY